MNRELSIGKEKKLDYIDRLKQARLNCHLRQQDASEHLGIAKSTYSMYETRKNKMDIETFAELCRLFGVTPNEMLGFDG